MKAGDKIICEHCDAVYARRPLARGEIANCARCGGELYRNHAFDLQLMFALTITGLLVFVIANSYPLVTLDMQGVRTSSTMWGAIRATWHTGVGPVAVLSALTVFIFPLAQLLMLAYVLFALLRGRTPPGFVDVMHALRLMRPWSMVEVFMLGILVSVVKMAGVAHVSPEVGIFGFAVLTLLLTIINSFDLHRLWEASQWQPTVPADVRPRPR